MNSLDLENRLDPSYYLTVRDNEERIRRFTANVKSLRELSVGRIRRGRSPEKTGYLAAGIPVIKTADITETFINWDDCKHISEKFYEENTESQPLSMDLMVTSTGVGSVGKVEIYDDVDERCLCSAKISIIHVKPELIDPYYLLAFLRSKYGKLQMESSARGATGQVELYSSDIERILVPIPSKEVQKQISDHVRDARQKWKRHCQGMLKAKVQFEDLLQLNVNKGMSKRSYIVNFADLRKRLDADYYRPVAKLPKEITVSSNWKIAQVSDFADVFRGLTPSRREYTRTGAKVVKTATLTGQGLGRKFGFVSHDFYNTKGIRVQRGDILIASTGEGSIGKADIYDINEPSVVVAEISVIRLRESKPDPYYVYLYFRTKIGRSQLERGGRGATGQQHLYPRDIARLFIPIPTEDCYRRLTRTLELAKNSLVLKTESADEIIAAKDAVEKMIEAA